MVDKQEELLKFVKHKIRDIILRPIFPDLIYKDVKKEYFFVHLNHALGMPKDSEIAKTAMEHYFKVGFFKDIDHLKSTLQLPFFSRYISNPEFYIQKFEMKMTDPDLNIKLLGNMEYKTSKIEEFTKQVIKERTSDIEKGIKEMKEAYDSITSKLELENEIPEPEIIESERPAHMDPWWKTLGLREDPFPEHGLGNIDTNYYERIIIKTDIYQRYVYYINNIPKELFKNIIFYGQYGCGKTTLFEYLKYSLIKARIDPIIITLSGEADYQNFLLNFKKALLNGLKYIYMQLKADDISNRLESSSIDDQIIQCFELIRSTGINKGFVIFIDDIYKPPAYEKNSLMFLNQLQTFKTQLTQQLNLFDIGFFISAPNEWQPTISGKPEYSGSISLQENMPTPTTEEARSMFNDRLKAFAIDEKKDTRVTPQFAQQVYQTLKSKNTWTFRHFIHECVDRFRRGEFGILISNPVSISSNTIKSIKQILERHPRLDDGIKEIFNLKISEINRTLCLELLVQIYKDKGFDEKSDLYKEKRFYLDILRRTGLIVKRWGNNHNAIWIASKDVLDFDKDIFDNYSLYLDDYFLKLFEGKLDIQKPAPQVTDERYLIMIEDLLEKIKKKKNTKLTSVQSCLELALQIHKEIVTDTNNLSNSISLEKFQENCLDSIRSLSEAVLNQSGLSMQSVSSNDVLDFWNDFWYFPESLGLFLKLIRSPPPSMERDKYYLFTHYINAFKDIISFIAKQIDNEVFKIPILGLKNDEIRAFNNARDLNRDGNYAKAAEEISELVEIKLREFLYSVFVLQYGDRNRRIQRIPRDLHKIIDKHEKSDRNQGFGYSKNELTNLTRENYCGIIVGQHTYNDIGTENWYRTFSKVFLGWNPVIVKTYFRNYFVKFNIRSVHFKDVFTPTIQADINQFIIYSIELLVRINESYYNLLQNVKKISKTGSSGSTETLYYFPLSNEISFLQPIRTSDDNRRRLIETFKRSRTNEVDLSSPCDIENKYGISYQEFFAILTDLLSGDLPGLDTKIKRRDPIIIIRAK